jgi:predicted DNA-binding protein
MLWSMRSATTIRVSEHARDRLNQLARAASTTTIDYVDQLVAELEEDEILGQIVESLNDPTLVADAAELDGTLMDGLDPNENFSAWR